jgi:homoserine dehydrogenase
MTDRAIGIALLGLGNVGGGVVKLLAENASAIEARLARLEIRAIAVREPASRSASSRSIARCSCATSMRRSRRPASTSCAS